jgi:hypothetical protein
MWSSFGTSGCTSLLRPNGTHDRLELEVLLLELPLW